MRRDMRAFMALQQRKAQMAGFGKEPTIAEKIIRTTSKLGVGGIQSQQGAAVNIFDTVPIVTNTSGQNLVFFKNASGKTRVFSNWQQLEFKAGESLGVEYLYLQLVQTLNVNLTDPLNTITGSFPIGRNNASLLLAYSMAQFKIANNTVFKDYQLIEGIPQFNVDGQGIAAYDTAVITNPAIIGRSAIKLPASPVVPPNQGVEFTLEVPPITLPAGNWSVMLTIGRQGSIFNAKNTL